MSLIIPDEPQLMITAGPSGVIPGQVYGAPGPMYPGSYGMPTYGMPPMWTGFWTCIYDYNN